ncbi:MAG TPA: hypothetical protein VNX29_02030 [Kaistia sp.]|nr:hypothetical protein [Kaistia sp.]
MFRLAKLFCLIFAKPGGLPTPPRAAPLSVEAIVCLARQTLRRLLLARAVLALWPRRRAWRLG